MGKELVSLMFDPARKMGVLLAEDMYAADDRGVTMLQVRG